MAYQNILDLEVNKVSKDINDYSLMLLGKTGIGKSPFVAQLYGKKAIMLSLDNSQKGIAGIYSVPIDSYETLSFYINQLMNPEVRKKFDVVIIDTITMMDYLCEKSVLDTYGKDTISDCLPYNKAWKIVDKRFIDIITKLSKMQYTMVYVCHPKEVKYKVGNREFIKIEPKISDRIKDFFISQIDIRLYVDYAENGERVLYTKGNAFFDARCRVASLPDTMLFDAKLLRELFEAGVEEKVDKEFLAESGEVNKNVAFRPDRSFEEVINDIKELGNSLTKKGLGDKAMAIVNEELGLDENGQQRTLADATERMIPALEDILIKMKEL